MDQQLWSLSLPLVMQKELNKIGQLDKCDPEMSFDGVFLTCVCPSRAEYSYAVSNENGNIKEKGKFYQEIKLKLDYLHKGFYQFTLFDDLHRKTMAFQVR